MKLNLTHSQKRIWYVEKSYPMTSAHNLAGVMILNSSLKINEIQSALSILIKNNSALQLRFYEENGIPYQYVDESIDYNIFFKDFSKLENKNEEMDTWIQNRIKEPFDLLKDKLFKFDVFKIEEEKYGFLLIMHHIISDGWTLHLYVKKLFEIINSVDGQYDSSSYEAFIDKENEYLTSNNFLKNENYWKNKFSSLPENNFKTSESLSSKRLVKELDSNISKKILNEVRERRLSLNTFFIVAKSIYDYKFENKKDIVYGIPVFNRTGRVMKNILGMFTSTMPVRFNITGEVNKSSLYNTVLKEFKMCLKNQKYPFDLLFEKLELRKNGYETLFDTYINYYVAQSPGTYNGVEVKTYEKHTGEQHYSLQLVIEESDSGIGLYYDYKTELYSDSDIELMHDHLLNIVIQLVDNDEIMVKDIEVLSETEKNYKKYHINSEFDEIIYEHTVIDLFLEQVNNEPSNIAVYHGTQTVNYKELDKLSNQFANYFASNNVGVGDKVGLMLPHSVKMIAVILGLHKCGACYIPITPAYPINRVKYMLNDSDAKMICVDTSGDDYVDYGIYSVDVMNIDLSGYNDEFNAVSSKEQIAYIIYTSGSTGVPKGVMVTHKNLANYAKFAAKRYMPNKGDIFAFHSSISFDLTITSIFAPLICGNALDIYYDDAGEFVLYDVLSAKRANIIKLTPSHLKLIVDKLFVDSAIDRFILGGENLNTELAKRVVLANSNIEVLNEYGPTEATVGCMIHKYDSNMDRDKSVPIGIPAANSKIIILDDDLNLVPNGRVGEIYIGGVGITKGYLNKEELTANVFIKIEGEIYYRSGDIARYLDSGVIEYIGRRDTQVKLRGHRIEVDEINNVILKFKEINNSFIIINNDRIQAYLVVKESFDLDVFKDELVKFLPEYMIPRDYKVIDEMPLTENGKVDTKALPSIDIKKKEFVMSTSNKEDVFISICEKVLDVRPISMNDNFFDLGGDSIKSIQIISKLKESGLELKTKHMLQSVDFKETCNHIVEKTIKTQAIQGRVEGVNKDSPMFEWFKEQGFEHKDYYTQSVLLELSKSVDVHMLKKVIGILIERHDVLRIVDQDGKWLYSSREIDLNNVVESSDLTMLYPEEIENRVKLESIEIKKRLDITSGPLINTCLFETSLEYNYFLIAIHHLAIDGVSWRILLDEFSDLIKDDVDLRDIPKTTSYKEWSEAFENFKTVDELDVKLWDFINEDFALIETNGECGENSSIEVKIPIERFNDISNKASKRFNLRTHELLVYATSAAVKDTFGKNDFLFELEHHGRFEFDEVIDVSKTLGWFTLMYPVHMSFESKDLKKNIASVKDNLRLYEDKGYQYMLHGLNVCKPNRIIRFNYLGDFSRQNEYELFKISQLSTGSDSSRRNRSTALFEVNSMIKTDELLISIDFYSGDFNHQTMDALSNRIRHHLNEINNNCDIEQEVEFARSDFDSLDISLEDFESLFE